MLRGDSTRTQSSQAHPLPEDEELFRYTKGRFLRDEARQLAERYVPFNVAALKDVAVSAGGAQRVISIAKLDENQWHRDLNFRLDNGNTVIARLPTRVAPLPQYNIPNQVATTEYVRTRLGIPTSNILAYSADTDPERNPVGTPYILIENPKGMNLSLVWDELSDTLKDALLVEWVKMESRLMEAISDGYGSIFYRKDVPAERAYDLYTGDQKEEDFVIGPDMDKQLWDDGRRDLDINRGPFATSLEFLLARSEQERAWLKRFAVPKRENGWWDFPEIQDPELHMALLDRYDSIAPYLIPSDAGLFRPTLLYNLVKPGHLFISRQAFEAGRIEITSVWDWQCISMRPCFQTARVPRIFRHEKLSDAQIDSGIRDPAEEKETERLQNLYLETTRVHNPVLHNALTWPLLLPVQKTIQSTHDMWHGNFFRLTRCLLTMYRDWSLYSEDEPCPLQYGSQEEVDALIQLVEEWEHRMYTKEMAALLLAVDDARDSEVAAVVYDDAQEMNRRLRDWLADEVWKSDGVDREHFILGWPW